MPQAANAIEWDDAAFQAALERVSSEGVVEARGVHLSADRLAHILAAGPEDPEHPGQCSLRFVDFGGATFSGPARFVEATFSGPADFDGATFSGDARFGGATFSGPARFVGATFSGPADFGGATFGGDARFGGATFSGPARFGGATFSGDAGFGGATFSGDAGFGGATFSGPAHFDGATFSEDADFGGETFTGPARFGGATFTGDAHLDEATFTGPADFGGATFSGPAHLEGTTFMKDAHFPWATFEQARELGPILVSGCVCLDRAVFAQPVSIEVSARRVSCVRAVFRAGADVFVRWAEVSLEDADFAEPSLVAELRARHRPDGEPGFLGWEEPSDDGNWRRLDDPPEEFMPHLVSVRRAKVASLTLSGVDLRACRFAGAHGLDALRLERVRFAESPNGWRRVGRWPRVRWTRRQTVAEEHHWRDEQSYGTGWYEPGAVRVPDWLSDASRAPDAEQIAGVYRALRKGREDKKDEPGAADFYYGEMEMRRRAKGPGISQRVSPRAERVILTLYWALSGYGLRASRALAALAIVIALFAPALHLYGFRDRARPFAAKAELKAASRVRVPPSPRDLFEGWKSIEAWTYTAGTATAIIGAPEAQLTQTGRGLRIVLRILGPLLIGFALLAIRGRVKR